VLITDELTATRLLREKEPGTLRTFV